MIPDMPEHIRHQILMEIMLEQDRLVSSIEHRMARNNPIYVSDVKALCETLHYIRTTLRSNQDLPIPEQGSRRTTQGVRAGARSDWLKALRRQLEVVSDPQLRFTTPQHRESAAGTHIR